MNMTKEQLKTLGLGHCVYIKPGIVNGQDYFIITHADGTPEMGFEVLQDAINLAEFNNYIPMLVH